MLLNYHSEQPIPSPMSLHPRLEADTLPICQSAHAHVRLMNDQRWPWVILVPVQSNIEELHDFTDIQRDNFMREVNLVSRQLQQHTHCQSVNVAMLGNVVSQLHCHVIARNPGDVNWPNPVWGFESATPYEMSDPGAITLIEAINHVFS